MRENIDEFISTNNTQKKPIDFFFSLSFASYLQMSARLLGVQSFLIPIL